MNKVSRALLSAIAATTLIWSCVESAPPDNDDTDSQRGSATKDDAGTGGKDAKADDDEDDTDDKKPVDDEDNENPDDEKPVDDEDNENPDDEKPVDDDAGSTDDGDMMSEDDAGTAEPPVESKIKGTAIEAECSSYGKESGGMCAGFYCGVTEADIEAELDSSVCTGATGRSVCSGELPTDVATCARDIKTAATFMIPAPSDEKIREDVEKCVYGKKTKYEAEVPKDCMKCFLDAAQCASDNCLDACLFGDSAGCDKCRQDNNCNAPVMECGDLPSPF